MTIILLYTAAVSPTDLTAEQLSQEPGSCRISWTPPTSLANLTGYHIYYSGANDSGSRDVGAPATNITIDNCIVGVVYNITMVAVSPHLPSPVIGPVNVTLPGEYCASNKHCFLILFSYIVVQHGLLMENIVLIFVSASTIL